MTAPQVRQDRRDGSPTFGFVAVEFPAGSPLGAWGYMSPAGGGFLTAPQVAEWAVLNA